MLASQTFLNYHLVLIDDGLTDASNHVVENILVDITIITRDVKLWCGGALHQGYLWLIILCSVSSDAVLFINDDFIKSVFLENGLKILQYSSKNLVIAKNFKQECKKIFTYSDLFINCNKLGFELKA
jgi:glycosyltransferase involved in cell wall biosynthesis